MGGDPVVAASVLLIGLIGGGIAVKVNSDQDADAAKHRAAVAAKIKADADAATAAKDAQDAAERKIRQQTVPEIEAALTKMAKKDVSDGVLDGPIYSTTCDPVAGGTVDDLTQQTTKFSCLVINKKNSDGSSEGYRAHAIENWDTGSFTYGLGDG